MSATQARKKKLLGMVFFLIVEFRQSHKEVLALFRRELKGVSQRGWEGIFFLSKVFLCFKKVLEGKKVSKKAS